MTPQQTQDAIHTLKAIVGKSPILNITKDMLLVTSQTYDANDQLGTLVELKDAVRGNNGTGVIFSLTIQDLDKKDSAISVTVFDSNPSNSTFTDGGAITINDLDLPKVIGVINVATTDYTDYVDNSVANVKAISLPIQAQGTTNSLWLLFRDITGAARGAKTLSASIGILQDA